MDLLTHSKPTRRECAHLTGAVTTSQRRKLQSDTATNEGAGILQKLLTVLIKTSQTSPIDVYSGTVACTLWSQVLTVRLGTLNLSVSASLDAKGE